jgi:signal transduction histidine kinase
MLYPIGLVLTVGVCSWIVLDLLSEGWRRRSLSVGVLAVAAAVWATGDLLSLHARTPDQRHLSIALVYVGACFLGACWLWVSAEAARPRWWRRRPWLVALPFGPSAFFYSCVFWDDGTWFVEWSTHARGPLFVAHIAWSWSLIAVGLGHFAIAAHRFGKANGPRMLAILLGTLTPLLGNALHLLFGVGAHDPTPVLLGFGGFLIRNAIVDAGLTFFLPLGRSDVVEQLDVGVLVADLEDAVVDANRAAHELLRAPRLRERFLGDLLELAGSQAERVLEVRCFPLRNRGTQVGTGVVVADRTDAQRAGQRLQLAARLEAVGSLTAGIAHEVNNPLAFVRSNVAQLEKLAVTLAQPEVLERLPAEARLLAADAPDLVTETSEGLRRIGDLVQQLRTFAREDPRSPQPQCIELARVARTALAMARLGVPPDAIRVQFEPCPEVEADETDLVQIAVNLLVNAIQAGGDAPRIELQVCAREGGAALRVLDRGPGIPESLLANIFDPFFTTKPPGKGTGLGLSLSYDLALRHGGRLEAENRPGGGAAFTLWLPAARPDAPLDSPRG